MTAPPSRKNPFAALPPTVRGAAWMVLYAACFAGMTAIVRHASKEVHPIEIAFVRNLAGFLFMVPLIARIGPATLRTQRFGMHTLRALSGIAAMFLLFTALAHIPIAETTALMFTTPLFATVGAALILKETVRARRWTATAIGFVGAVVILRPGEAMLAWPALFALGSAACIASSMLLVKSLSRTEPPETVVFYVSLLMTIMSLPPALLVWTWPSTEMWLWMAAVGIVSTVGQIGMTRAFAAAEASAVLPFDFSRLLFAAAIGFVAFGELPDLWTWVGAGMIFAAVLYTAHREAKVAKAERAKTPPPL